MEIILEKINSNKNQINKLEYKITDFQNENKQLKILLIEECKKNGHHWIIDREECLYGETHRYCKICGKDKVYDYTHF